jgi:hypothetical protein
LYYLNNLKINYPAFSIKYINNFAQPLISWLRDENEERSEDLPEPEVLAREAVSELTSAIGELEAILAELAIV